MAPQDDDDEAPTLAELFGERVVVAHPERRAPLVAGKVIGVEEMLVVACDDGSVRRAALCDVEPEEMA